KTMVLGKVATSVSGYAFGWHDPGVFEIMASVDGTADIDKTRALLLETIDKFRASPVDKTEVERAKTKFARSRSLLMSDSNRIGISLSDWAAKGDWRLFFLFRDLITKVTPEDVQRVAQTYLTANNSTVGTYYPTDKAERIKIPASPDLTALLKDYKGGQVMAQGEFFDPSVENIIQTTTLGTFSPTVKYAYLPKKTRNQVVSLLINIHYGNDKDLAGKNTAAAIMPLLLTRGTQKKTRQEIDDTMAKLQAQWRISGSAGELQISILCRKDAVNGVLTLLHEVLHEPAFSSEELETIKRQSKDLLEKNKTEPGALANRLLQRKLSPHLPTDVRYTPTFEESAERLNKLTIEDIKDLYKNIFGVGEAEVVVVGDFEPQIVSEHAKKILDLKSKVAFKKIETIAKTADKGEKLVIDTPDKENAMFMSGIVFPLKDSDPDFVGLAMADFIIGSGSLSSRLGNRVRQKEGLAYGVRSGLDADAEDLSARFMVMASCNPSKIKNVDIAVFDEIKKFVEAGIDATEFAEGQKAFLAQMKIERTTDSRLASILAENLTANRSMEFYKSLELKIKNLTSKEVVDAFKKHVTADKMITIWAGDFNKKN
ncbi:MAG: insulinase family protein, partial [Gemmataceae bacterium]|nr:insulinase family protein [Gemmataceae bacterium]